jgi:hypothetical protein
VPWDRHKLAVASRAVAERLESRLLLSGLPSGWSDNDVGSPPIVGSASYNNANNTFTLSGSGAGIGSSNDQLNFANYSLTGSGSITAEVNSLTNTDPAASAGVMIRADTAGSSLIAAVDLTAQNTVVFSGRSGSGFFTFAPLAVGGSLWLRVADSNGNFTGYYSTDDVTWTQIGTSEAIAMPSATVLGGIWASSNNGAALNTAVFSSVSLTQSGWSDVDIGSPSIAGSAVYDSPSDTTTISGNGADIFGAADQFNFDSTTMTGDGSAIAYVNSLTNTDGWAKAGVMIRNDNTASSAFAAVFVSPTNGIVFEWRSAAGASVNQEVSSPAGGPTPAPVGLKVTRSGSTYTGYYSTDGISWIAIGPSQTATLNTAALGGIAVTSHNVGALCTAAISSVSVGASPQPDAGVYSSSDQLFLSDLEQREVQFYWSETNASTGMVPDSASANGGGASAFSSIAATGFGLTALTVGDERGWISHANAYNRALTTINFLYNNGANVNGFFYHFLNPTTGARYGTSEVSSVDTAELMAGVLDVGQYWAGTPLQTTSLALYNRVNWPWMQQASGVFYGQWTPESGFQYGYGDFSEAVVLYLLALGSPTHPSSIASWYSWSRSPSESYGGYNYIRADDGALFTEQYPQDWFNLQGLTDKTGLNYYVNSQNATLAQRAWMMSLSSSYPDYGPNMWGWTPAAGPNGYIIWGGPPANVPVDGTVVPAAAGGSLEFNPRLTLNVLENMKQTYPADYQKYGLIDSINPYKTWSNPLVLGIDVGPTIVAAENARDNFVWNTFMQTAVAQQAVAKAFVSSTPVWYLNGSGNYNLAGDWTTSSIPNAPGAVAEFLNVPPPGQTVFTNSAVTLGTLHFNSATEYALAGTGSLTLQAAAGGNATIEVDQGTALLNLPTTLASNTIINVAPGATLVIGNPMTINSGVTLTQMGGGTVIYQSTISVAGGASVTFTNSTYAQSISMAAGATTSLTGAGTVLELNSVPTGGTLDLNNNTLLINYTGSADPIALIRAQVASGYANGLWNGVGMISSAARNNPAYAVGYADAADPGNPAGLASGTIEVKYALIGDADLNGVVNGVDYGTVAANFNKSTSNWDQGDFNYDGVVNGVDFGELAANFNKGSDAPAAAMPVTTFAAVTFSQTNSIINLTDQTKKTSITAAVLHTQQKTQPKPQRSNRHG